MSLIKMGKMLLASTPAEPLYLMILTIIINGSNICFTCL